MASIKIKSIKIKTWPDKLLWQYQGIKRITVEERSTHRTRENAVGPAWVYGSFRVLLRGEKLVSFYKPGCKIILGRCRIESGKASQKCKKPFR